MKKRLRKKLRLVEFQEFGFEVRFSLSESLRETDLDRFWDSFILDVIEARGLMCGGSSGRSWSVFVTRSGRQSPSQDDREFVLRWLESHSDVQEPRAGPLVDAWYPV